MGRRNVVWLSIIAALLQVGCGQQPAARTASTSATTSTSTNAKTEPAVAEFVPKKIDAPTLPNAWQIHSKVISGGLPEGDAAFKQLADLGVKTVISVDGAKPDMELAKKYGLRYVHLPHGYDGVPQERAQELAKAVRDLPGTVYIHCHHGKHRSPAAAAVACVGAGMLSPAAAVPFLKAAGTSENYKGLYESAGAAQPLDRALLDELKTTFPETNKLPPMAEAMVAVEHTHDHLKEIAAAGWQAPPKHPDLDPAHEALLLGEHFTELLRTDTVKQQPEKFRTLLQESERDSQELASTLREWKAAGKSDVARDAASVSPNAAATTLFEKISANCKSCHTAYRDVPLTEKVGVGR